MTDKKKLGIPKGSEQPQKAAENSVDAKVDVHRGNVLRKIAAVLMPKKKKPEDPKEIEYREFLKVHQNLVSFGGKMIPPEKRKEFRLFLEETAGRVSEEFLTKCLVFQPDGKVVIEWPDEHPDLNNCNSLTTLPSDFHAGHLSVSDCLNLTTLPNGLRARKLACNHCRKLESIPDDLVVEEYLGLVFCTSLKHLPDTITLTGELSLWGCDNLKTLPSHVHVKRLNIMDCMGLQSLPEDMIAESVVLESTSFGGRIEPFQILEKLKKEGKISHWFSELIPILWPNGPGWEKAGDPQPDAGISDLNLADFRKADLSTPGGAIFFFQYWDTLLKEKDFVELAETVFRGRLDIVSNARRIFQSFRDQNYLATLKQHFDIPMDNFDPRNIREAQFLVLVGKDQVQKEIAALKKSLADDPSMASQIRGQVVAKIQNFNLLISQILPPHLRKRVEGSLKEILGGDAGSNFIEFPEAA